jgi:hypothetical protein
VSSQREGGRAYGEIRYRLASEPLFVHCCYCLNCKAFALFFSPVGGQREQAEQPPS